MTTQRQHFVWAASEDEFRDLIALGWTQHPAPQARRAPSEFQGTAMIWQGAGDPKLPERAS